MSFETAQLLPLKAYGRGLNGILPEDIAVVKVEEVPPDFDPRRWSLGKRYRYLVSNAPSRNPTRLRTHWEVFTRLDRSAMQAAAVCLVGRHDFSAFRSADCQALHAVRLMREVRVEDTGEDVIQVEVEGTAFLKHMVRAVVGSLVAVGKGRHPASWMRQALESKDRSRAGPTAPPQGLTLLSVRYGEGRPAHLPPNEPGDG